jgi:N-acetylglucosaminyldiphosphoundecaprenol N-acetyl-beta-D-mannosaminyltransferase
MTAAATVEPGARPARVRLLGGEVDLVTADQVMAFISARVAQGRGGLIANHNLHSLYLQRRLPRMRDFYRAADLIEADSKPLILWGRLLGAPIGGRHRCTYLDWRETFWARAQAHGWRVFYLGGAHGVAEQGATAVRARFPQVRLAVAHGYFDARAGSADNDQVLAEIAAFGAQVLLVGMGMPRQEQWIFDHAERLRPYVVLPVGAAFDYEAGVIPTPPRWLGRMGLEWAYRFVSEPGRLFTRYFLEPWALLLPALEDIAARLSGLPVILP